jgi:endoglucanase
MPARAPATPRSPATRPDRMRHARSGTLLYRAAASLRRANRPAGAAAPPGATHARHPALALIKLLMVFIVAVSLGTFNEQLVPLASENLQQYLTIAAWLALIYASLFPERVLRIAPWNDTIVAVAFLCFAIGSVTWSNYSSVSVLKGLALAVTTFGAYRLAVCTPLDDIVDCAIAGLTIPLAASLVFVIFLPEKSVIQGWMYHGLWTGIFASKQSLGFAAAFLMFFAAYRAAIRSGRLLLLAVFVLACICVVGSGSRGGGTIALAAIASLYLSNRFAGFRKALALTPLVLIVAANALIAYLAVSEGAFIPWFGNQIDLSERTLIWQYALDHFRGNAVLVGYGLNGFWSNPAFYDAFLRQHGWVLDNFHNGYIAILMETGIVGMALFVLMYFLSIRKLQWLAANRLLSRRHYGVLVCMINLLFLINFTETVFLRSTNFTATLLIVALFICCQAPRRQPAQRAGPTMTAPGTARRRTRRAAWTALCVAACALAADLPPGRPVALAQWSPADETAHRMGRGVNILSADGIWDGGFNAPFRESYFKLIYDAGFGHVRINLPAFKYMDIYDRIRPDVLNSLDWVIDRAVRNNLIPVIDEHDFTECQLHPEPCGVKLVSFWKQISKRYAGRFPTLVFEILNEPGGHMTPAWWNALLNVILSDIRERNPDRTVVVAAINSEDPEDVKSLELPSEDTNIIVTVHYYKPMRFTHQGAEWSRFADVVGVDWGSDADRRQVARDFDVMGEWAKEHGRPLYLGEFGAYEGADMAARARYLSFIAREAERRGWAWAYWQFDHDFALFDMARAQWVAPILRALISPADGAPPAKGL